MKIKCLKSDLLSSVQIVYKAVPSKTTMTILECILIDATQDIIKLVANDTELGIETTLKGDIEENGFVCLEAKIFMEIVRKLPDNIVSIEVDDKLIATIKCEKAKFNIVGKSGEEFSYLPVIEKNNPLKISQFDLKEMVRHTIFSIAAENENNKIMKGELFEIENNKLHIVALDGHRIAINNYELKEEYNDISVIIPGKTLNELIKIIDGDINKNINIYFTDKHVLFEFDDTLVLSRLIEGKYFEIKKMISNDYETKVTINRKELTDSIERASLMVKEGDKKPITINIEDGNLNVRIDSTMGSLNEDIDIEKTGKDLYMGFNNKFFLDILRVLEEEKINLYMVNSSAPCFIKDDNETYNYILLPVNIKNSR